MMDWILNIYDQTEHLLIIASIIAFIVSLYFVYVLDIPKPQEWHSWGDKVIAVVLVFMIIMLPMMLPGMYLRDKSLERKEAQVEQQQSGK